MIQSGCGVAYSFASLSWQLRQYVQRLPRYKPTLCESFCTSLSENQRSIISTLTQVFSWVRGKKLAMTEFRLAVPRYELDPINSLKSVFRPRKQITNDPSFE